MDRGFINADDCVLNEMDSFRIAGPGSRATLLRVRRCSRLFIKFWNLCGENYRTGVLSGERRIGDREVFKLSS